MENNKILIVTLHEALKCKSEEAFPVIVKLQNSLFNMTKGELEAVIVMFEKEFPEMRNITEIRRFYNSARTELALRQKNVE